MLRFSSQINWTHSAIAIILVIAFMYLFLRWFERANVWAPRRVLTADPSEAGFQYEELFLETPDRVSIHCWYIPHPKARGSLLFCHGNGGNIGHRIESLKQFYALDMNVMLFSYRGYGKSSGWLSEQGTYTDAETAYAWLKQKTPDMPIVLFGRSMGSAIATELATKADADALIFESGFLSIPEMGKELFPWLPIRWFNAIKYNSSVKIADINMPLLVIHSPEDELIPYEHGRKIYEAAHEPKQFMELTGSHNEGHFINVKDYLQNISMFLEQHGFNKNPSENP